MSRAPTADRQAPTRERQAHAKFELGPAVATDDQKARAGVRVYRLISPLDRLLRTNIIEPRHHQAGMRLRRDYEIGIIGAREPAAGSSGSSGNHYSDVQLDAIERAKAACAALGPTERIVLAVVVHDYSIAEFARQIGGRRQEVAGILKLGLTTLARHYQVDIPKQLTQTFR